MLICSNCGHEMAILVLNDTEIDYCLKCGSIWLDKGELDFIINKETSNNNIEDSILQNPFKECLKKEKKRRCPICSKKMAKKLFLSDSSEIILDVCAKHGIWFDENELYEIVKNEKNENNLEVITFLKDLFNAKYGGI